MSTSSRARVSVFRRFGWLAVALTVLMSIVGPGTSGVAAAPMPVSAARAAAPDAAAACGLVPIDVELIIDHSGSMTSNSNNGHTREYWAQQAAFTLIDALQANGGVGTGAATSSGGRHRVGVTQFSGTTASVVSALASHDAAGTKPLITSTGNGNTPFKTGMSTGAADLTSHARGTDFGLTVQHVIVFLSDGRPNPDGSSSNNPPWANTGGSQRPTQSDGNTFRGSADQVFSIAVGSGGGSGSNLVDLALMQALAKPNDSAHYTNIVDSSRLPAFFASVFQTIACPSPSPSPAPTLTLVKKADPTTYSSVGATIAYTYTLKNTGNVTLSAPYSVSDDKASVSCPASPATLAPNASVDCTASYTITQADLDAGSVTNKATGQAMYGDSTVNSNQDTATVTAAQASALHLDKTAKQSSYNQVGDTIDYTYVVKNTGNVTLSGPVTVNDDKAAVTCPAGDLAPDASISCTATYTVTQADLDAGSVTNKATAHAGKVASNQATATVNADQAPTLTLVKKADPTTYSSVGATIAYTYTLKNTGNVTLSAPYSVSDDKASVSCPASPATLAPNASVDCTASYTITQADLDAGSVTNKATGQAMYGDSTVNSNQDTATVTAAQASALHLDKTAKQSSYNQVGDTIDYTYVVKNTGNVTLSGPVTVNDDKAAVTCPAGDLAPDASISCTATYTVTQADLDAGSVTNKATAHATFGNSTVASNQASVTVPKSDLGIVKTADTKSYSKPGDILHYTLVASNSGSATLHNVTISDPLLGTLACLPSQPATLDAGQSMTCTGTYTVTQADVDAGKVGNTATASSAETKPVQGSAEVPAAQAPAMTIVKNVSLDGESYGAQVTTTPGTTVHYRIVVTNTGNVTLTGVTLSDDLVNLTTVGCSIPGTLAVGQHFTCDYTLSAPAGVTVNTATADSAQTSVLNDSATVTAPAPTSIVIRKILDLDGNLSTTNDRVPAAGWTFNLSGDPGLQGTTNGQGIDTFDLTGLLESGTFTVSEVPKAHYTILTASCTVGEGQSRGTFDKAAASMDQVVVRAGETVTCTFVNTSGAVSPATATPRVTPPSTSTLPADGRTSDGGAWRIVLLALAALMASTLVLTTSAPKARRRR